jgi:hypothetical protein
MEALIRKYAGKLVDAEMIWNRDDPARQVLEEVFAGLNIQSLLFCPIAEPYRSVIDYLAGRADGAIFHRDTETRTFFHDLPVASSFRAAAIIEALKERKCVIVSRKGIVMFGTVSPEQAFITFRSVCFAAFVKFFTDYIEDLRRGSVAPDQEKTYRHALAHLDPPRQSSPPRLQKGHSRGRTRSSLRWRRWGGRR